MRSRCFRLTCGLTAVGFMSVANASAQEVQPAQSSALPSFALGIDGNNRPSQTAAPVGPGGSVPAFTAPASQTQNPVTQWGIFTLTPGVTMGSYYDDNVFALSAFRRGDAAFFVRPELSATAGGDNYGLRLAAFVEGRKYAKYSSEDQVNAGASAAGVVQFDRDFQLRGQLDYVHGHEDRGTGESAFIILDRPVTFDQMSGAFALNKRFDKVWTSLGAGATGVLYQNDTLQGQSINETYRNAAIPTLTARVGYVVAPLTSVFVDLTGNTRNFNYQAIDSVGYRVAGGVLFEPGPGARVKGEAFGGFMHQDYQGIGLQTIDTWTYGTSMSFLLTDVLTLSVDGRREAKETPTFGGSLVQTQLGPTGGLSLIETSIAGRFNYQLLPNLVVGAGAAFLDDSFQGTNQEDRYITPLASLNYTVSKHVTASVDYRRLEYRPNIAGITGFQKDVVMAAVHGTF